MPQEPVSSVRGPVARSLISCLTALPIFPAPTPSFPRPPRHSRAGGNLDHSPQPSSTSPRPPVAAPPSPPFVQSLS